MHIYEKVNKVGSGKYKMILNIDEKVFLIKFFGQLGKIEVESFFVDYEKYLEIINRSEYHIILDTTKLYVFKPAIVPYLERAYKSYYFFKKVTFVNPVTIMARTQLKRVAKEVGTIDKFDFVNNINEISY